MSGGPFRVPQPADRRTAVTRTTPRQAEEPRVEVNQPRTVTHGTVHGAQRKEKKRSRVPFILVGILLIVALAGYVVWSQLRSSNIAVDGSKYQAVFFTNGQVYFGKLSVQNQEYLRLRDVYYLQTQSTEADDSDSLQQAASSKSNNVQLIKLGDEIHGPEDEMIIAKDQVLFYENLKQNGKVSESIKQHKGSQ